MKIPQHGPVFDHANNPERMATPRELEPITDAMSFVARQAIPASDQEMGIEWHLGDGTVRYRFEAARVHWEGDFDSFYFTRALMSYIGPRTRVEGTPFETRRIFTLNTIIQPEDPMLAVQPNAPSDITELFLDGRRLPEPEWDPKNFIPGVSLVEHEDVATMEHLRLMQPAVGLLLARHDQFSQH